MNIAILGSGNVGAALATGWVRAGHNVTLAARDPHSDKTVAASRQSGAAADDIPGAVDGAEVVLLATPWAAVANAISAAGDLSGKILLDATNPLKSGLAGLDHRDGLSGAQQVQALAPRASVVKIFNTTGSANMSDPRGLTMFHAADSAHAGQAAAALARDIGFEPADAGPLAHAALLEYLALLWITLAYKQGYGPAFGLGVVRR